VRAITHACTHADARLIRRIYRATVSYIGQLNENRDECERSDRTILTVHRNHECLFFLRIIIISIDVTVISIDIIVCLAVHDWMCDKALSFYETLTFYVTQIFCCIIADRWPIWRYLVSQIYQAIRLRISWPVLNTFFSINFFPIILRRIIFVTIISYLETHARINLFFSFC